MISGPGRFRVMAMQWVQVLAGNSCVELSVAVRAGMKGWPVGV